MKRLSITILLLLLFCLLGAQANPFTTRRAPAKHSAPTVQNQSIFKQLASWQKELNSQLHTYLKQSKDEGFNTRILLIWAIALLFGILHALGPGHGKTVAVAYFMKEQAHWSKALQLGGSVALTHCGISVVLGAAFSLIGSLSPTSRSAWQQHLGLFSGVALVLLGCIYGWKVLRKSEPKSASGKNHILLGMAVTVSIIGVLTISSHQVLYRWSSRHERLHRQLHRWGGLAFSLVIGIIGISIILAAM
jgi:ABC-type nickel/cobalt efflux system permease component RcnA